MTTAPETVSVPVELFKSLTNAVNGHLNPELKGRAEALLPKPKPRLVAVDITGLDDEGVFGVRYLKTQPDLLTLLDDGIDHFIDAPDRAGTLKSYIRKALGVSE